MSGHPSTIRVRNPVPADLGAVVELVHSYCSEILGIESTIEKDALERDGFGRCFDFVVAEEERGPLAGFGAWGQSYDLHWGVRGAMVLDLFVRRQYRGYGAAHMLLASICRHVAEEGGCFLSGQAIDDGMAQRMCGRSAIAVSGLEFILGGSAFRRMASLDGMRPMQIARNLPTMEMNHQP